MSVHLKELGKRLAGLLDEDDWGYIEPFLNRAESEHAQYAAVVKLQAKQSQVKNNFESECV